MFTRKGGGGGGGKEESPRSYNVSAPILTTQHKYEDLVDEDLLRQLKIQAAISQWQTGDNEPSHDQIDKKKHVVEDIKARKKREKKEKKEQEKLKKKQLKESKKEEAEEHLASSDHHEEHGASESTKKLAIRKRSTSYGEATVDSKIVPKNHPLSTSAGEVKPSLIKRTTLGTLTRRKGRDRCRTDAVALSDPARNNMLLPIKSESSLRDDSDEEEDLASSLLSRSPAKKSKSYDKDLSVQIIAHKKLAEGASMQFNGSPSPQRRNPRELLKKQYSDPKLSNLPKSLPSSPMKAKSPETFSRIRPTYADITHHFTSYVRPKLPTDFSKATSLKGLFDARNRLTLDAVMQMQREQYPTLPDSIDVPVVLLLLSENIVALQGLTMEGIFRVSGHETELIQLRQQMNEGNFKIEASMMKNHNSHNNNHNNTAYHLANLFKEFLRNLKDPVIPSSLYFECIKSAEDPRAVLEIVENKLPEVNRQVLLFVINWLQENLLNDSTQKLTRMDIENLSIVFAGCLIACPENEELPMEEMLRNMQMQKKFVANLLISV